MWPLWDDFSGERRLGGQEKRIQIAWYGWMYLGGHFDLRMVGEGSLDWESDEIDLVKERVD
jgi:hypothetical protein